MEIGACPDTNAHGEYRSRRDQYPPTTTAPALLFLPMALQLWPPPF
jgi:hypothetical protein